MTLCFSLLPLWGLGADAAVPRRAAATASQTLLAESFGEAATPANAWLSNSSACLTAGTSATPSSSIPACGTNAAQDPAGSGALQLTGNAQYATGMSVYNTPLPTANGLIITFTYEAFGGQPGADGMTSFLSDASKAVPATAGNVGGDLGYAGPGGIANGYLGIGYDTYGNYSGSDSGRSGGPGQVSNSLAVRGSDLTQYAYLGGYTSGGNAASLPFALNAPAATARPSNAPTMRETLTPAGALTVEIDRHDGSGFVTYFNHTIVGTMGEAAVPANVYLGFAAATGGSTERHQITGLLVTTVGGAATPAPAPAPSNTPLESESFTQTRTAANAWSFAGDTCLTAGNGSTPVSSIPGCGSKAPMDAAGSGALLLTAPQQNRAGFVVLDNAVSTASGIHVSFTSANFDGSNPGADGIALFLTDGSKPRPTAPGAPGGGLGYSQDANSSGLANAYLGVAFDEFGNFSTSAEGPGGPGQTPQTIAVRGSAAGGYAYLGGYAAGGKAASLPFALDAPASTTRPSSAPLIDVVLTPAGQLTVSIDRHDGAGLVAYETQRVVGVAGQAAVPASVYVGLTATCGGSYESHQISNFVLGASTASATPSPAPKPTATPAAFSPPSLANLGAWYDATNANSITQAGGTVSAWKDLSGHGNTLAQSSASLQPQFTASGIDGLGSLTFNNGPYLIGTNGAFSTSLFNESTVFFVSNQAATQQSSSLGSTGAYLADPRWDLRLTEGGTSNFDFNNKEAGRLSPADVANGPAIWTAEGSLGSGVQQLRKDGNVLSSSTGPGGSAVTGNYPFVLGATTAGGGGAVSYQYSGQLGEVVIYNRLLPASDAAKVEGYLACKWGLQNRLPANHMYRTSCPQGGTAVSMPVAPPASGALSDPQQLRSANGQLVFNVVASQSNGTPQLTYNGSAIPPTLRLLPGDTLVVNLTNNLPTPPSGADYLNDTNLHYHGLHVSPNAPGDDSIDLLAMPGQSLHYQIAIPTNHPTGLYWYHSHAHGEAERQNLAGMSGALVIDGISQYAPQVSNMPERILIARDAVPAGTALPAADRRQIAAMGWAMAHTTRAHGMSHMSATARMSMNVPVRANATSKTRNPYVVVDAAYRRFARAAAVASTHCTGSETASKSWTLNGQSVPTIGIRPGEHQFWRLVNAGSDTYLDLAVDSANMQIVALDGVPLASVGSPALTVSHYLVPPASRIEFVVTGPAAGTTAYLRTNCFDAGSAGPAMPAAVLAKLDSSSSLSDNARVRERISPRAVRTQRHTVAAFHRYAAANASMRQQTLVYSDQNTINGLSYDPGGAAQFYAQSGTMEQWQIVNNSNQVHTFHIHQVHFLVQQIVGGAAIEQSEVGQVLDNINVPAENANGPGTVTLTMDFSDPAIIGTFLLHCHILSHEDMGMMAKITVGKSPPMSVNPSSLSFASATAVPQTVTISGGTAPYSLNGCSGVAAASVSGTTINVKPSGSGSCVLTVADNSNLTANVAINVAAPAAVVKVAPASLAFTSSTAATQSATISGGTTPYAVSGCANVANASISGSTLSVTPSAVGSCTLTVKDAASNSAALSVTVNAPASGSPADNLTFHQNNGRQGWYGAETQLTSATVASTKFGLLGTLKAPSGLPAFGKVYAQPLYAGAESIGGTTHNLVLIATMTDQVYAYDDKTFTVVWERSFINPNSGITQQASSDTGCNDVNPDIGITATPVIDRAMDRMYVAVATKENGAFHIRLHAISLQNGADVVSPVEVSASVMLATGGTATTNPEYNFSRSALLEANGNIYVGLSSHCDYHSGSVHGWLLAYSATNLAPSGSAANMTNGNTGSGYFLGAIWMSGFGPAADAQGNVYVATGNGPFDGTSDFAMSFLKLPGTLNVGGASYFTPIDEANQSGDDVDLGSGGIMLLPDGTASGFPHLAIGGGKQGTKFMVNRDKLGGQQSGDAGAVWQGSIGGAMWGGPAFYRDGSNAYVVYGGGSPIATYAVNPSNGTLSVAKSINVGCLECRNQGSQPIVSSNGTAAGSAVVWALKTPGNGGGSMYLYAFDASKMTTLYNGLAGSWMPGGSASTIGGALVSPVVAGGRVYVPADGTVSVFGLSP